VFLGGQLFVTGSRKAPQASVDCPASLFLLLQLQLLLLLLTMLPLLFKLFNSLLEGGGQAQGA
jgi:hypothetical protein